MLCDIWGSDVTRRRQNTLSPAVVSRIAEALVNAKMAGLRPPRVDEPARHREPVGQRREAIHREPLRVHDLALLAVDLAARVLGQEGDHERVREGPALAAEVAQAADLQADLLVDLAPDAVLQRLGGLHEAGECAVDGRRETRPRGEQQLPPIGTLSRHQDHHGWRDSRVVDRRRRLGSGEPVPCRSLR